MRKGRMRKKALKAAADDLTVPHLRVTLLPHQRVDVAWMKHMAESKYRGGLLADDVRCSNTLTHRNPHTYIDGTGKDSTDD